MKNEKQILMDEIKDYVIILDDYINKRYKYTLNTEELESEIKIISACLIEAVEEIEQILQEETE